MSNQTRVVVYGSNRLNVEDSSLTPSEIQASMSEIFPELKNATYEVVGNEIRFTVKAGTKGATRVVVYGSNRLNVEDSSLTPSEIQASMSEIFPELKNATYEVVGNEIRFTVKAGTKGSGSGQTRVVVYGSNRLNVEDSSLTPSEIQASMSEIFPELKNATYEVVGNEIRFTVKAGTKGMTRVVVYGSNRLNVEDSSLTPSEIQASMSEIFPELKNATYEVVGNEIRFTVKAGTKGMARVVVYGSNRLNVEDDSLKPEEIQASMSEIFPELKNATFEVVGDEIRFTVKAGTKGARVVVYGSNRLNVEDDSLKPEEIQASMSEIFPELKNATFEVVGDEIRFTVKAGTKGARFTHLVIVLG
jgi:hypothetical protein